MLKKILLKIKYTILTLLLTVVSCSSYIEANRKVNIAKSQVTYVSDFLDYSNKDTLIFDGKNVIIRKNKITYQGYLMRDSIIMITSSIYNGNYFILNTGTTGHKLDYENYLNEQAYFKFKDNRIIFNKYVTTSVSLNKKLKKVNYYNVPV